MKINTTLSALALGFAAATVVQALPSGPQVPSPNPVYISGSTAFRAQIYAGLTDMGLNPQAGDNNGNNIFTFTGTPNVVKVAGLDANLTSGPVTVYCSFDGSAQGVNEMVNVGLQQNFEDIGAPAGGGKATFTNPSDLAFSDVSQSSTAYPSNPGLTELIAAIAQTTHLGTGMAVQPFLWAANSYAGAKIANIDNYQIDNLLTSGELTLNYWTGNAADNATEVKLTGRDNTSGTRITAEQLVPWNVALPINQWTVNGAVGTPGAAGNIGAWTAVGNNGYGSGGNVGKALGGLGSQAGFAGAPDTSLVVGYLSFADAKGLIDSAALNAGSIQGTALTYDGINPVLQLVGPFEYNIAAVENGQWPFWSYEHLYESANIHGNGGFIDADFGPGLILAVDYEIGLQVLGTPQTAILIGNMNVKRTQDGGIITKFP
jgi:hypothetical protein